MLEPAGECHYSEEQACAEAVLDSLDLCRCFMSGIDAADRLGARMMC